MWGGFFSGPKPGVSEEDYYLAEYTPEEISQGERLTASDRGVDRGVDCWVLPPSFNIPFFFSPPTHLTPPLTPPSPNQKTGMASASVKFAYESRSQRGLKSDLPGDVPKNIVASSA
jgi:hypothetical protein